MNGSAETCEVRFDQFWVSGLAASGTIAYGVASMRASRPGAGPAPPEARVLAPATQGQEAIQTVDPASLIPIPADLSVERALILPRLARALWVWDEAGLELGENAIVTSGSVDAALFCLVASWRTGRSPLFLDLGDGPRPGDDVATVIPTADPQAAIEGLASLLRPASGAAAVVLSASARATDIVLEALPTWGRILLATAAMEPAAVDFYNNVHRKGARLLGAPSTPMCMFDSSQRRSTEPQIRRATRILEHEDLATSCVRQAA